MQDKNPTPKSSGFTQDEKRNWGADRNGASYKNNAIPAGLTDEDEPTSAEKRESNEDYEAEVYRGLKSDAPK